MYVNQFESDENHEKAEEEYNLDEINLPYQSQFAPHETQPKDNQNNMQEKL